MRPPRLLTLLALALALLAPLPGRAAELLQVKPAAARAALTELLLAFDVYRTYAGTDGWSEADAALLARTVKRAQAFKRHILTKKTTKNKRHLRGAVNVHETNMGHIAQMLPFAGL